MEVQSIRDLSKFDTICYLALIFWVFGIVGWVYEMLFYRLNDGMFVERGQGFGPWLPIYGFGAVFICLFAMRFRKSMPAVFLMSALVSGVVEYLTGWVFYTFFDGLRLWDYNTEIWNWGNINGYICLRSILLFAFSGVFLIYIAVPMIGKLKELLAEKVFRVICIGPAVLFIIDILGGYILHIW
jgi:uncharacterized membrane protein